MKRVRQFRNPGWTVPVVLGMIFLRALVPAGFMLAPVEGRIAFVLCAAEMPAGTGQPPHRHHHPGAGAAAPHAGVHGDPSCPYAQSAGSAPLPTLPVLAGGAVSDRPVPPPDVTQTFQTSGPDRQQTSRGPPLPA